MPFKRTTRFGRTKIYNRLMLLKTFIDLHHLYCQAWLQKCQEYIGHKVNLYNITSMINNQGECTLHFNSDKGIMTFVIINDQIQSCNGQKRIL